MPYVESRTGLKTNHKFRKLCRCLSSPAGMCAVKGALQFLWEYTLENSPDGVLPFTDAATLAMICEWDDDADVFLDALISTGFIDQKAEKLELHDWENNCGNLYRKRKLDAERKRQRRLKERLRTQNAKQDVLGNEGMNEGMNDRPTDQEGEEDDFDKIQGFSQFNDHSEGSDTGSVRG